MSPELRLNASRLRGQEEMKGCVGSCMQKRPHALLHGALVVSLVTDWIKTRIRVVNQAVL